MNAWQNLPLRLIRVGTYSSPPGGSHKPAQVKKGQVLFECIQEGFVYGFDDLVTLHGEGSIFCHQMGECSVSESPPESYYQCFVAWFESEALARPLDWPRHFTWKNRQAMHAFTEEILHAFHYAMLDGDAIGPLILARLGFELERSRSLKRTQGMPPPLRRATDFINRHYAQALSLHDISRAAEISASHLHTLFRKHLNQSPHQYLVQKRLHAASHALVTGSAPVKSIAADAGYSSIENFSRAFQKFFGRSPSVYRQIYSS